MAAKAKTNSAVGRTKESGARQTRRLWLMFPPKKIQEPVIWALGQKFQVVTNIRQASITDELGIVCLELEGPASEIAASIRWLEKSGINVEPVEINVLES